MDVRYQGVGREKIALRGFTSRHPSSNPLFFKPVKEACVASWAADGPVVKVEGHVRLAHDGLHLSSAFSDGSVEAKSEEQGSQGEE